MARPGDIVAERGRGIAAAEHRTGVAHHGDECLIVGRLDLEVLGRDEIGDRHGLLRRVGNDHHAARAEGRFNLGTTRGVGDEPLDRCRDLVGKCVVPGDEPGEAVGTVLGLQNHIDGGEISWIGAVGDHDHLGWPGKGRRDADRAGDLLLGERDIDVARTDDDIDGPNRLGAMRDGADRLRPADRHDLVGACDLRRREHDVGDLAIRAGRDTHDDLFNARHPRRNGGHEHGRGIDGPTPGDVAGGPFYGAVAATNRHTGLLHPDIGRHLGLVVGRNPVGGEFEGGSDIGFDALDGGGEFGIRDHEGVEFDTVEATRVLTNGGVAPLGHSGENVPHDVDGPPGRRLGPRQDLAQITRESSEVDASKHALTLSPGLCGPCEFPGMMLSWIPTPPNSPRSPLWSPTLPYGSPVSPSAANTILMTRSSPAFTRSNAAWSRRSGASATSPERSTEAAEPTPLRPRIVRLSPKGKAATSEEVAARRHRAADPSCRSGIERRVLDPGGDCNRAGCLREPSPATFLGFKRTAVDVRSATMFPAPSRGARASGDRSLA